MNVTDEVIRELMRTLARMTEYKKSNFDSLNNAHAAAYHASTDCTKALAKWRKAPLYSYNPKTSRHEMK